MGKWQDLTAKLKALVIKFARLNGVSDIKTIRDTYNLYSSDSNHKYAGNIESTLNLSIIGKDRVQDIAYRIMSLGPAESRSTEDIIKGIKLSYNSAPYELNYSGTNMYGAGFGEAAPDPNRDSNYMFLYGNEKGHYIPITKEEYRGHSYIPFIKEHYPNKKVYNYRGLFIPLEKVELPTYTKSLVEFLSKNDLGTYNTVLDPKNEEEFNRLIASNYTVDDVGSFRTGVGVSPKGNPEFLLSDIIDFDGGYYTKWGLKAGIQGALLNAVGNPFMLRLYIPIEYTNNPEKINESGISTLLQMAAENNVASTENDGTLHLIGSPFEIEVTPKNTIIKNASGEIFNKNLYKEEQLAAMLNREWLLKSINPMYSIGGQLTHKKSTGGPLYPFSFEKNPFLKTPVVRYDEGGQTYTVKKGDTFSLIALNVGVSVLDLQKLNPTITNVNRIREGLSINIPPYMFSEIFNTPQFTGLYIPKVLRTQPPQQQNTPILSVVVPVQKGLKTAGPLDLQELAVRQAYTESRLRPEIVNDKGAYGLFQIMLPALDDYNRINKTNYTLEDMKNADNNIKVRNWYMDYLSNLGFINKGDIQSDSVLMYKTLAAFNAGAGPIRDALTKAKADGKDIYDSWDWVSYLWDEPREYADFILRGIETRGTNKNDSAYKAVSTAKSGTANKIRSSVKQ